MRLVKREMISIRFCFGSFEGICNQRVLMTKANKIKVQQNPFLCLMLGFNLSSSQLISVRRSGEKHQSLYLNKKMVKRLGVACKVLKTFFKNFLGEGVFLQHVCK